MFDYAVYKGKFALIISQFGLDLINYSYKYKMGYKGETWRHIALNAVGKELFVRFDQENEICSFFTVKSIDF